MTYEIEWTKYFIEALNNGMTREEAKRYASKKLAMLGWIKKEGKNYNPFLHMGNDSPSRKEALRQRKRFYDKKKKSRGRAV